MEENNINRGYFAVLPANVRYDKRITANAKLLFAEITALTSDKGYCWATNRYFSELYQVNITTISKWISSLEQANYIAISHERKNSTTNETQRKISMKNVFSVEPTEPPTPLAKRATPLVEKSNPPCQKEQAPLAKRERRIIKNNNTKKENIYIKENFEVLEYLNQKANSLFSAKRIQNTNKLEELFDDGFTVADVKKVIDKKVAEWKNTDFAKYLRPDTLFGDKFESYLYSEPCKAVSSSKRPTAEIFEHGYSEAELNGVLTSIDDLDLS